MRLLGTTAVAALLLAPIGAGGQSLLDRPPDISGDWVGAPGTVYFNFVHRFTTSDAPERKVSNVPTFLVAAGLPGRLLAGFNYSTNSTLAPNFPNEWEGFARWAPISEDYGAPLDLGAQIGYNNAASGVDGEVSVAKMFGPIRILLAGRALTDPVRSGMQFGYAGGTTIRLGQYIALAGDVGSLTKRDTSERVAWSAGLHFAIPLTPHTLSIQVTNIAVATLQGQSRGSSIRRYGFEFTIPLTLSRYFGSHNQPSPDSTPQPVSAVVPPPVFVPDTARPQTVVTAPAQPSRDTTTPRVTPSAPPAAPATVAPGGAPARAAAAKPAARIVRTGMKNIHYLQPTLEIEVGTTVEWKNNDPLLHSVTAVNKSFDSGLIQPGKTYRHTFTRAGTFSIYCVPHPFMKGTIVVKEP
jgi:plastocyanin